MRAANKSRTTSLDLGDASFFTLLELLVVIAVIAILASLMLPSLALARNSVKDIACKNNLRQLGYGMMSYTADNGDFVTAPYTACGYTLASDAAPDWTLKIGVYAGYKNAADLRFGKGPHGFRVNTVFQCPTIDPAMFQAQGYSAACAYSLSAPTANPDAMNSYQPAGNRVSRIIQPSQKFLLLEIHSIYNFVLYNMGNTAQPNYVHGIGSGLGGNLYPVTTSVMETCGPHTQGSYYNLWYRTPSAKANYLFCDGSVRTVNPPDTYKNYNGAGIPLMWDISRGN